MPRSHKGHNCILCVINEATNYLITVPIFQARLEEIGEALIENVITKYCISKYIIMDQDSTFMSSLMTYLLNKFGIEIKTVAPYNHHPFRLKHGIKSLSHILTKHLTIWVRCGQSICHLQHLHTTCLIPQIWGIIVLMS